VRRRLRALEHDFPVCFDPVPPHERLATLDRLAWFHERRWDGRGGSTAFSSIPLRAFHADASRRMFERGWLRLYALRLDGVIVAAMYGFFYNRRFYFYQHGFDDTYASYSLGLITMALSIRAAIAEGAVEFDMLYGTEGYKRLWAPADRPLAQIHAYRPGLEGVVQRHTLRTRRALGQVARRFGWK
jgi:CelD/BcsL family acetyltransferase involved in cellulose biosynthesis